MQNHVNARTSSKMELLDLPSELFVMVIKQMISAVGLYKAVRLRLVNKLFDEMVLDVILTEQYVNVKKYARCEFLPDSLMARYLFKSLNDDYQQEGSFSSIVYRATAFANVNTISPDGVWYRDEPRRKYVEVLCNGMASYVRVEDIIKIASNDYYKNWDPEVQHQATLVAAAGAGDIPALEAEIEKSSRQTTGYFGDALTAAVRHDRHTAVKFLLEHTAPGSYTPLQIHAALLAVIETGNVHVACLLTMERYAFIPAGVHYETLTCCALSYGRLETVHMLLARAKAKAQPALGSTAFLVAAAAGRIDAVQQLLTFVSKHQERGFEANRFYPSGSMPALEQAAFQGRTEMVKLLLERCTDSVEMRMGNALVRAAWNGHVDVARLLLDMGADVNACSQEMFHPYTAIAAAAQNDEAYMMWFLLGRGADVNAHGKGTGALRVACAKGYDIVVQILLEAGVSPDGSVSDVFNRSMPILWALRAKQQHIVDLLLRSGASKVTPLGYKYGISDDVSDAPPTNILYAV